MSTKKSMGALGILAAAALVMSGCSSTPSTEEASAQLCTDITGLSDELGTLREDVTSNPTLETLQVQTDNIRSAASSVQETAGDASQAIREELSQARAAFDEAVDGISPDASLTERALVYASAVQQYRQAVDSTFQELGCSDAE